MLVHNLKSTKARSKFIQDVNLKINIYKYEPSQHLELVEEGETREYPKQFELYKDFKEKEAFRIEYEHWLANERVA